MTHRKGRHSSAAPRRAPACPAARRSAAAPAWPCRRSASSPPSASRRTVDATPIERSAGVVEPRPDCRALEPRPRAPSGYVTQERVQRGDTVARPLRATRHRGRRGARLPPHRSGGHADLPPARSRADPCRPKRSGRRAARIAALFRRPGKVLEVDARRRRASRHASGRSRRRPASCYKSGDHPLLALRGHRRRRHSRRDRDADRADLRDRHRLSPDLRKGDRFSVVYEMLYESGELVATGTHPRRRIREPGPHLPRGPLSRRGRQRRLLLARRHQSREGVPSLAGGVLAHELRLRRALPSDLQELARPYRRRLRGAEGNTRARGCRRAR